MAPSDAARLFLNSAPNCPRLNPVRRRNVSEAWMRRVCLLASLLAAIAGTVCADSTATLVCNPGGAENSLIPTGDLNGFGCFKNQFINTTAWDSLDWGTSTAQGGLGPAVTGGTPLSVSTSLAVAA